MSEVEELRRAAGDYRDRLLARGRRIEELEGAAGDLLAADDPSAFAAAMRRLEAAVEGGCTADHEHIEPGDPRYDGFRVTELWAFVTVDPADDQEGLIGVPPLGLPALAADRRRVESLTPIVRAAAGEQPVRLLHFALDREESL